ncbi:hypothetical protein DID88_000419 [Monilinia fructigena]|uniref:Uncharacterized protein n=1 Tax=Monilinia fructigena TaxID=38457 RepID=A0A395IHT9_9HELO|nr:hypothetical protein DID88_000419 [Monilinia fructigena]
MAEMLSTLLSIEVAVASLLASSKDIHGYITQRDVTATWLSKQLLLEGHQANSTNHQPQHRESTVQHAMF